MGKLGRVGCIATPMCMSIASLVCLIIVFLSGVSPGLRSYYFMRADMTEFTANPDLDIAPGTNLDEQFLDRFRSSATSGDVADIYQIYIWNHCSSKADGTDFSCSPRRASYWFNPIEVWGLEGTEVQEHFPQRLQDGLNAYRKVAGWMFGCYAAAACITAAEIILGLLGICSRMGSLATTIVSGVTTLLTIAGAATSTALYGTLTGTFNTVLEPMNVRATMGRRSLAVCWLAAAFSTGAGLFWLISSCCCSGKSSSGDKKRGRKGLAAEKAPYTYERVSSPFLGGGRAGDRSSDQVPLRPMGGQESGYEPYRHDRV